MRKWMMMCGVFGVLLGGCSDEEAFPVGVGYGRNDLKQTYCSDKEKCRQEAFYRHGRFIQN